MLSKVMLPRLVAALPCHLFTSSKRRCFNGLCSWAWVKLQAVNKLRNVRMAQRPLVVSLEGLILVEVIVISQHEDDYFSRRSMLI